MADVTVRKKIAFVEDGIFAYGSRSASAVGGAERAQWLLARLLAANGWLVCVGVRQALRRGESRLIDGVEFVGIGSDRLLFALRRFLQSEQPTWLYCAGATHLLGATVEMARLLGVGSIFSVACDLDVEPRRATLYRPAWWPLYHWGLSRADRIFVQHTQQLSALALRWRSKAHILPKLSHSLGITGGDSAMKPHSRREYVAWVAMLGRLKRPDILIEIARRAPAIRFVVCGGRTSFWSPSGYGDGIVDALRATSNIEYLGQVPPEKAQQVIADAAVLLSTSDVEGFPNTFLQAWSSGTPVVSLNVDPGGVIGRHGLGVVVRSIDQAVNGVVELQACPRRRDCIGVRAHQYVTEAHSEAAVLTAFTNGIAAVP
jgi:glycosyltransferase involved in cell wall biosynthesis